MIPNPYPGLFIVFEGVDGCGKSIQLNHAFGWMKGLDALRHREIIRIKEPNKDGIFGKKIYADLADKSPGVLHKKDPRAFQTWYACDSKENLKENVIPALQKGSIVLCDRFRPSMVYGAKTFGDISTLMTMNCEIIGEDFIWPDIVLVFDITSDIAIERLKKKGLQLDEHEKQDVLSRVRRNYMHFVQEYPNCKTINAGQTEEEVFEKVKKAILPVIESKIKHIMTA